MRVLHRVRLDGMLPMFAAALLSVVGCHDATAPSRAPLIKGPAASLNTVDSPDVGTVVLGSVDLHHGNASATANIYYPYATIVKVTATGVIYKNANYYMPWWYLWYSSGTQPFYPAPDASMGYLHTGVGYGFSPTTLNSDSSGSGYLLIPAISTITGASRNSKSNESCEGGQYSCNRIYCGPVYGNWCFNFSGSAGSFTIERQAAGMNLNVDSTSVATGSNVKFSIRSTVDSIAGMKVPVQLDTAGWIPDPDSLGGEYSDSTTTGACNVSINTTLADCTRKMTGSGTVRIVAHINGKGFVQTQHVTVVDAHPLVSARKNPAYSYSVPTDSVTFTASMSDGSTASVTGWAWVQDSGSVSSSGLCASSTTLNPCKEALRETGTMTVTVTYKGRTKHAMVHVDLIVCPTRDSVLDDSLFRSGAALLYDVAHSGAPPYRIEALGYLFKNAAGDSSQFIQALNDADACHIELLPLPTHPSGWYVEAYVHIHPFHPGIDSVPPGTCKNIHSSSYINFGYGASQKDLGAAANGIPSFIVDPVYIYRVKSPDTPGQQWPKTGACTILPPPPPPSP
jgi:hypothetical protein